MTFMTFNEKPTAKCYIFAPAGLTRPAPAESPRAGR
jgi:hypothetical protein